VPAGNVLMRNVTFDCHEPLRVAEFWAEVFGWRIENPGADSSVAVSAADGSRPRLLFERVPEGKQVKNRVHLDLQALTGIDAEVARLTAAGATVVDVITTDDGAGWTVLADPEGNEFCVC
jgi:predicted enzyme related to lactoylglutathione lyase